MTASSAKGRYSDVRRRGGWACPAGLSTTPSAQTTDVRTPELWFGYRSSATCRVAPHPQEFAAPIRTRPVEVGALHQRAGGKASGGALEPQQRTGARASMKVTKLETGLPGRARNQAPCETCPACAHVRTPVACRASLPPTRDRCPPFGLQRLASGDPPHRPRTPPQVTIRSCAAARRRSPWVALQTVGDDAQVIAGTAQGLDQAAQGEAVRVVDPHRLERVAGHGELVAGGEQRHPRPLAPRAGWPRRPRPPGRGPAAETRAPGEHDRAGPTSSPQRRIHSPGWGVATTRTPSPRGAMLLHHHGISARRDPRACEDAGRSATAQRRADAAGGDALAHRQGRAGLDDDRPQRTA